MFDLDYFYSQRITNRRFLLRKRTFIQPGEIKKLFFPFIRMVLFLSLIFVTTIPLNYVGDLVVSSSYLALRHIRFEGCNNVHPQELIKLTQVREGTNILFLHLEELAQRINANPWVKEVKIEKVFPHLLNIKVEERVPVALINHEKLFLVDREGNLFKEVEPNDNTDLPVITGISFSELNAQLIKEVLNLLDNADQVGILPKEEVSEVHFDKDYGLTFYTLKDAIPIRMGIGDFQEKLKLLASIKEDMEVRRIEPKAIDIISLEEAHVKVASSS